MEFEIVAGRWGLPKIELDYYTKTMSYNWRIFRTIQIGHLPFLNEEEIIEVLNHEYDHWAQDKGSENEDWDINKAVTLWMKSDRISHYHSFLERNNRFAQLDNMELTLKIENNHKRMFSEPLNTETTITN